jgi:hypothetical protein
MDKHIQRLRGRASELDFASKWYNIIDEEKYQLLEPSLDYGWDWKIAHTNHTIQVKRFTQSDLKAQRTNGWGMDLRRNQKTTKYTGDEFDYLAIHAVPFSTWMIVPMSRLIKEDGTVLSMIGVKKMLTRKKYMTIEQLFSTIAEKTVEKPVEKECIKKYNQSVLSFV